MKLSAGCLLTLMLAVVQNFASAQQASAIRGKVMESGAEPADAATVVLLRSQDSSVVQSTITGKEGVFSFSPVNSGSYLLFITKLNCNKLYSGPYQVADKQKVDIGIITLKQASKQLTEVIITGKKDPVEVHPDKTVLNVEQNIMASGSSLYDVLTTSPGVKVVDDQVLYRGGQRALIAINGKPVLLTGDELINLLKNYQSSSISQIELIDNPGAKYDASAGGGMINIILKKNKNLGSSASVTQSAAIGQDYKFNTGLSYNLRTEKVNLFAAYGFQDNKTLHTIYNDRNINTGGNLYNFGLNYDANIKAVNNNFNAGLDYEFAHDQTIGFLVSGFYNDNTISKQNATIISTNDARDSSINTQSMIRRNISNMSYDLNYKGDLDKAGNSVLSADADYSDYNRHSEEMLQNDFFNPLGQPDGNPIFYRDNSPSHITIKSANIDFTQTISKTTHMEAGVKTSSVKSDNQIEFDQLENGGYMPVADLTDHFVYNERINATYLGFESKFNETTLSLKLRDEQTTSSALSVNPNRQIDSSYNNLFPDIQLKQELGKNNQLTVFYTRNINRPNYQDLNPFVGYVDQFYYSTGNPFLKPAYLNTYQVSDLLMNKYKGSFSVIVTDNYFYNIFEQNDTTKVYTSTKANLGTRYQYVLEFDLPFDLASWWHIDVDFNVYHEKYNYSLDSGAVKQTNGAEFYLTQSFKINSKLSAQLYNVYQSAVYFAISQYRPLYYMNAGLSYSIMQNKGSIRLAASDIFNTWSNQYHTNFSNLDITAKDKVGSRFVTATFSYRFGASSNHSHSNTSDEQKRLGGSSNEN